MDEALVAFMSLTSSLLLALSLVTMKSAEWEALMLSAFSPFSVLFSMVALELALVAFSALSSSAFSPYVEATESSESMRTNEVDCGGWYAVAAVVW